MSLLVKVIRREGRVFARHIAMSSKKIFKLLGMVSDNNVTTAFITKDVDL